MKPLSFTVCDYVLRVTSTNYELLLGAEGGVKVTKKCSSYVWMTGGVWCVSWETTGNRQISGVEHVYTNHSHVVGS